jgi:hypothetical protein
VEVQRTGATTYFLGVALVGLLLVGRGVLALEPRYWSYALPLAALLLIADLWIGAIRIGRGSSVDLGVTSPVVLATVILIPAIGVPVVTVWGGLGGGRDWKLRSFNMGMYAIAGAAAASAYHFFHGVLLSSAHVDFSLTTVLLPYLAAALVFEMVNGLLVVVGISLNQGMSPLRIWYGTMSQSALPMFVYSTFGLMLAVIWSYVGVVAAVLVLVPLLVARWVYAAFALRQEAYEATMRSLIQAVETKDYYTRGHSERVASASVMIGRTSGMREDRVETLRYAGMLHDVGKLGVPTEVLQASGRLTDEQYEAIQLHPTRGRDLTKDLAFLGEAVDGIYYHHERIDGRGYPVGLKGEEIPEFARIIAVADAFDSMTTTRSYRGARTVEDAIVELRRCKGSQFDPVMVESLVEAVEAQGWQTSDTSVPPDQVRALPSFASDDDDPTVADRLGLIVPVATPNDASSIDEDHLGGDQG